MTTIAAPLRVSAKRRPDIRIGLVVALVVVALVAVAAVVPTLLATHEPTAMDYARSLQGPSPQHWLGTDESGRDLYSRLLHGTRQSLLIGLGAAGLSILLALVLGSLAALAGRVVAGGVGWVIEILFAFPNLLLALLMVAVLGPSALVQVVAIGIGSAPGYARIVRGQMLSAKDSGYVEAAVALGHSRGRILRRHILPNAIGPLVAIFTLAIGQSIVWASGLAFLGLGVAPPSPEWGALLDAGRPYVTQAPWLTVVPGLLITVLALAVTTLGKYLQIHFKKGES